MNSINIAIDCRFEVHVNFFPFFTLIPLSSSSTMREGTLWMHEVFNSDLFMFFVSNGQKVTFVHQNIIQPCVLKNSWNHYILGTLPPFLSSSNYLKNASKLLLFGLRKKKLLSFFVCRSFIVEEKTRLFALAKWLERNNCKSSIIDPNIVTRLDFCERSEPRAKQATF